MDIAFHRSFNERMTHHPTDCIDLQSRVLHGHAIVPPKAMGCERDSGPFSDTIYYVLDPTLGNGCSCIPPAPGNE